MQGDAKIRNEKTQPEEGVFATDIPQTSEGSGGRPMPETSFRSSKPWKNKHFGVDVPWSKGVDVHDPCWTKNMKSQDNFRMILRIEGRVPRIEKTSTLETQLLFMKVVKMHPRL